MAGLVFKKAGEAGQYLLSILLVCSVAAVCYGIPAYANYHVVAYILLITVSLAAMVFDIIPVLISAILSALIWDFFFIPPRFAFTVTSAQDSILLLMYFVIALVNAVLTYKIRQMKKIAMQKAGKANTIKLYNTLLNSLSHELRTPIATIIAATDNLQFESGQLTGQNKSDLVAEISKASLRLNQQVENLLNMSRLESGFIQPKNDWCDINEVVHETVQGIEQNNISQTISISIPLDMPFFMIDKGMLEQVLHNLLTNATRYTPPGSVISITVAGGTDSLHMTVEDSGDGFPPGEIKNVFDKFYRVKNNHAGGTGLGLSIVKGFTEAMGGSVRLESAAGAGARFTIQIPAETSYLNNLKNE
ncbi:MAG: ATP-binding protein [Bacteroidota bacterium]